MIVPRASREGFMTTMPEFSITFQAVVSRSIQSKTERSNVMRFSISALNGQPGSDTQGALLFGFNLNLPGQELPAVMATTGNKYRMLQNPNLLAELFLQMYRKFSQMDPGSLEMLQNALLGTSAPDSDRRDRPWLEQARAILHEEFAEQPTLSLIAAKVGVHPVHLAREFRQRYGSSVGEYVRKLRVEFACHQLLASDDPPVKIATAAGFVDQSHFSRTFKRFLGTTPGKYRAALRSAYSLHVPNGEQGKRVGLSIE
jgi:AraC-like DNA-binding protein